MKKITLIILLIFSNTINAELVFDFHIHEFNISNYPMINLKGIIESPYEEHIGVEDLILSVNGKLIEKLECEFYKINSKHIIFEIRYASRLPEESEREYLIDYQYHGFHNGYGQKFSFKPNIDKITYSDYKQNESNGLGTDIPDLINLLKSYTKTIVNAENGLIVREKPSVSSNKIGKLKFKNKYYVSTKPFSEAIKIEDGNDLIDGKFKEVFF